MADSKLTIEFIVKDGTKPSGPKKPTPRETVIHVILLLVILSFLGLLDSILWGIQDFASIFDASFR